MESLVLLVPTYNGHAYENEIERGEMPEFGPPHVQVLIYREDGVRIVLGSDDPDDLDKPDIKIERRPRGWAIFLHPLGGSDPSGYIYFVDDGRSFLVKETGYCATPVIEEVDDVTDVPEIDDPSSERPAGAVTEAIPSFEETDLPKPDSVVAAGPPTVRVRSVDDCLMIEQAYEFASELRSIVYCDPATEAWKLDMNLGAEVLPAVKALLEQYDLAPFLSTDLEPSDEDFD